MRGAASILMGQLPSSVPYKLETHDNPWIRVVVAALGEHRGDLFLLYYRLCGGRVFADGPSV